jgi:flagellar hook-length control protein FliK
MMDCRAHEGMNMPTSNAINLLPPKPLSTANVNNANDSSQDDSGPSFEQTLDSARKTVKSSIDSEKPAAKKINKADRTKHSDQTGDKPADGTETDVASKASEADDASYSTTAEKKSTGRKKTDHQTPAVDPSTAAAVQGQQLIAPPVKADKAEETAGTESPAAQAVAVDQANKALAEETGAAKDVATDGGAEQAAAAQATAQAKDDLARAKAPGIGTAKVKAVGKARMQQSEESANAQSASAQSADATDTGADADAGGSFNDLMQTAEDLADSGGGAQAGSHAVDSANEALVGMGLPSPLAHPGVAIPTKADAPLTPEAQFAQANHPTIVTGVQGQLLPNGGTMMIRLDPPELGALQVTVHLRDGVMTAAFETSNDDATRLLSHSLDQLKTSLESAGVNVEKLHVQQAPRQDSRGGSGEQRQQPGQEQQHEAQQEQQRREMLRRMWRKLSGGGDPLDMVA